MTFRDLLSFEGRIGRRAFVLTQVGVFIAFYLATFVLIVATGAGDERQAGVTLDGQAIIGLCAVIFAVHAIWISLAASVKRCHDRGMSGWMLLFVFPPVLGQLWLFLSLVTGEGEVGRNRYGRRESDFGAPALSLA